MSDAVLKRLREMHKGGAHCNCPVCSVARSLVDEVHGLGLVSKSDRADAAVRIILKILADQMRHFPQESRGEVIELANNSLVSANEILNAKDG